MLNLLRRTVIPPVWALFRRIPGGLRVWNWAVQVLGIHPDAYVDGQINTRHNLIASARSVAAPVTPVQLCKVCDLPEFDQPEWSAVARELGILTANPDHVTKKYWEYVHLIYGLKQLQCLTPTAKVLSVGCGFEIPLYYLANQVEHVHGIDLFEGVEDLQTPLDHPERYVSFPVRSGRVTLRRMDGRYLDFADASFDVVYSLSSIEHFGGHAAAAQAIREIGRVLKPGGVAAVATELILNEHPHPDFFLVDELFEYVIRPSGLSLIGAIEVLVSPKLLEDPPKVDEFHRRPFLIIFWGNTLFASVMVFLKKT